MRISLDGAVITDPARIPLGAVIGCAIPTAQDALPVLRPDQVRVATPADRP